MDRKLSIATAPSARASRWSNKQTTWLELVERLSAPVVSPESYAEYKALSKEEQSAKKDVGGFVGGYLIDGKRTGASLRFRDILCLDLDFAELSVADDLVKAAAFECVVHSTRNHCSASPRFRLIAPLSRGCSGVEYEAVARRIAERIGMQFFDPSSFQPIRLMYWPSRCRTGEWVFERVEAPWVDVDELLRSYINFTDLSEWPRHELIADKERVLCRKEVADPLEKKGIVGAFCRAFSVEDARGHGPVYLHGRYRHKGVSRVLRQIFGVLQPRNRPRLRETMQCV